MPEQVTAVGGTLQREAMVGDGARLVGRLS